jgi:hypothetical protein
VVIGEENSLRVGGECNRVLITRAWRQLDGLCGVAVRVCMFMYAASVWYQRALRAVQRAEALRWPLLYNISQCSETKGPDEDCNMMPCGRMNVGCIRGQGRGSDLLPQRNARHAAYDAAHAKNLRIARDWICHTMFWRHDTRRCYLLMAYDLVELEQVEAA